MGLNNTIRRIFSLYIGKHFSKQGIALFGHWLRAENNEKEKDEILQQVWMDTESKITDDTFRDWKKLNTQLHKRSYRLAGMQWLKYAAVIIVVLVFAGGTYWQTVQMQQGRTVEMIDVSVPYGDMKEITLPDHSMVWLYAGSTIVYPKDFKHMDTRSIYLIGEASFSVAKNKEQPFIVNTSTMDVQAVGTVFTVEAYPYDQVTTATLEEGCVKVTLKRSQSESYLLNPSEQLTYFQMKGIVTRQNIDIDNFMEKRKGYLIFNNMSLQKIISDLEKKYGVIFQYNSSSIGSELYNIKFNQNESIEQVMEVLQQLIGINYQIKENHIILYK